MDGNLLSQVQEAEKELKLGIQEQMLDTYQKQINKTIDVFIASMVFVLLWSFYNWVTQEWKLI